MRRRVSLYLLAEQELNEAGFYPDRGRRGSRPSMRGSVASVIGTGRHRGLPAVLRSGAGRSALRIIIPRKNFDFLLQDRSRPYGQKSFRLSSIRVTGPSLASSTDIMARNSPVATVSPVLRLAETK